MFKIITFLFVERYQVILDDGFGDFKMLTHLSDICCNFLVLDMVWNPFLKYGVFLYS